MNKENQTDRKLKNLKQQIRQVARQVARCWALLQKSPSYVEPPMELDIRDMISVSKM